ncbi:cytochrome c oxidase polypeptide V [Paraphysoderma sedebokerense]|nr:cytochrome c oxidase polypeptide V [Paraphysoderma sedebokerense]
MFRTVLSRIPRRSATTVAAPSSSSSLSLADIPARWKQMSQIDREVVTDKLLDLQKGDWKKLSVEEKKSLYYIAFGPHGPRERLEAGFQTKVALASVGVLAVSAGLFYWVRTASQSTPRTISKEWQEASNELAKQQKANPLTGIASDGYDGKGFVATSRP